MKISGRFLSECVERRARKTWKCQARQPRYDPATLRSTDELIVDHAITCPVVIPRGSMYVEDLSYATPFSSGRRYSIACAEAHLQQEGER